MVNSLFLSEYLVFVIWKRSTKYFGQFLFFVLSAVCIRHQTVLQTHFSIIQMMSWDLNQSKAKNLLLLETLTAIFWMNLYHRHRELLNLWIQISSANLSVNQQGFLLILSLIDVIITSTPQLFSKTGVLRNSLSDHFPIFRVIPLMKHYSKHQVIATRKWNEEKVLAFRNNVKNVTLETNIFWSRKKGYNKILIHGLMALF